MSRLFVQRLFVRSEVNSMTFHDAIMTFQFIQLTLRGFIVAYSFCDFSVLPTNEPTTLNSGRIGIMPLHFATGSIRFFIGFFFFFVFKPIPIFVLTFITAQTVVAAALSLSKNRIFRGNPFPRLLSEYFVSYVSFEIFVP